MKTPLASLSIMACAIFLTNCSDNTVTIEDSYYPLAVGNYWVYDWLRIDPNTGEAPTGERDSVMITGDTIINGKTYFIRESHENLGPRTVYIDFVRDSSGYLVNSTGRIFFSSAATTDTLVVSYHPGGGLFKFYQMEPGEVEVVVPLGAFETRNFRGTVVIELNENPLDPRYIDNRYAQNVGKVVYTAFYAAQHPIFLEARLVDYEIR